MNGQALNAGELEAAAMAADYAANASTFEQEMAAMTELLRHERAIQLGLAMSRLSRLGGPPPDHERLPLMDEDGYDWGRVEARIPEDIFWGLYFQKDFGEAGFFSEEGLSDLKKAYPVCRTKTVSGKTVVGYGSQRDPVRASGRRGGVTFGRGTMMFAT